MLFVWFVGMGILSFRDSSAQLSSLIECTFFNIHNGELRLITNALIQLRLPYWTIEGVVGVGNERAKNGASKF
jgi:hypothetical protein